ncbi:Carboxyl esterase family II protein [Bacillus mycoides]|uniref:SGNH/GDSL hydrolase family protein n=1 Tax=Bacillus mycoides TaxID=1405 RepID=UPI0001A04136|nr:SGNH/GDSL hydrolase family protein [Bacillus mycoides]EEK75207.1 Carboxyl esterase family II protein [Bacillus mycoides]
MADAPRLLESDKLWQGIPKINQAIDNANEALKKSGMNFATLYSNGDKVNISYDWANKNITFNIKSDFNALVISDRFSTNLPQGVTNVTATANSVAVLYNRISKEFFTLSLSEIYTYKQDVNDCCLGYVNFTSKYSTILVDGNMTTILPGVTPAILFSSSEKVNIDYDWKAKTITFDVKQQYGVLVQTKNWSANLPVGKKIITSSDTSITVWWNRITKEYFTMSYADAFTYKPSDDDCYLGYVHFSNANSTINIDNASNAKMALIKPTGHYGGLALPTCDFARNQVVITRNLYMIKSENNIKYLDVPKEIVLPFINNNGTIPTWQFLWYNSYLDKFFLSEQPYYQNMRNEPNIFFLGYFHYSAKVFILNNRYQTRKTNTASIIGDSISTYQGYVPEGNAVNGNYMEAYRPPYRCWWYGLTHNLFNLVVNESWGGRRVTKTRNDDNASWALHRVASLEKDGIKPDVVFVELGMNDLLGNIAIGNYDGVIDPNDDLTFANCYARLVDGIQKAYPETRIYCLTIPFAKGKTYLDHKKYNDAIKMIADQYYATVIDVTNIGVNESNYAKYTFDGVHPNDAGMNLITGRVYNTVRENTLE